MELDIDESTKTHLKNIISLYFPFLQFIVLVRPKQFLVSVKRKSCFVNNSPVLLESKETSLLFEKTIYIALKYFGFDGRIPSEHFHNCC